MGLLQRLGSTVRSGLSAALAPAADPRQGYVSAYQKQRELLDDVVEATRQVSATKERLQKKAREVEAKLPSLEDLARAELRAGRAAPARLALQRRQVAASELKTLEQQLAEVAREETNLQVIEERLATQVEAFAARQEVILARYSAAEAQVRINEAVTGVSQEFAELTSALLRAEEKAEHMEARASAIDRLLRDGSLEPATPLAVRDSTEREVLPAGSEAAVEAQLAALQRELEAAGG